MTTTMYIRGRRSTTTVFEGAIFRVEIEPTSQMTIAVKDTGKAMNWLGGVFKSFSGLHRVAFDDSRFEDKFEVFATNEAEARRLITPQLIETTLKLARLRGAEKVEFGMYRNNFLLKVDTERDLFEPVDANKSALTTEDSRKFLEEFRGVLAIVRAVAQATKGRA